MSEILTLAETFKQKSNKQAELIEEELDSVMQTLNESMTARLQESENIIKNGTASLSEQNEQLQLMLNTHRDDTYTALSSYTSEVQARTGKALKEHTEQMQTAIEVYMTDIQALIENKQSETYQVIKADMSKWAIIAGVAVFMTLILGLLLGLAIAKKVIKPTVIYYEEPAKTQQYTPYNP